jgi:hypothetical protein
MVGHIEGRIAFIKAELKITDAQEPLWNDTIRSTAKAMGGMVNCMFMMQSSDALPDKLAAPLTLRANARRHARIGISRR